jgi:hypothetical protein
MKNNFLNRFLRFVPFVFILVPIAFSVAVAQESKVALPRVAGAAVPLYPPLARAAHVQGVVHVKLTTDGQRAVTAHAEDGPKLLAAAAEENARTWQFAVHEPTTFTVTYRYKLVAGLKGDPDNPEVVLRLPTEVEVRTLPMPRIVDPTPDKSSENRAIGERLSALASQGGTEPTITTH